MFRLKPIIKYRTHWHTVVWGGVFWCESETHWCVVLISYTITLNPIPPSPHLEIECIIIEAKLIVGFFLSPLLYSQIGRVRHWNFMLWLGSMQKPRDYLIAFLFYPSLFFCPANRVRNCPNINCILALTRGGLGSWCNFFTDSQWRDITAAFER